MTWQKVVSFVNDNVKHLKLITEFKPIQLWFPMSLISLNFKCLTLSKIQYFNIESYVHVLELLSFEQNKLWKFEIKDKGLLSQIVVHFAFIEEW